MQKCQMDNRTAQEERDAADKRRKAAEEAKANRSTKNAGGAVEGGVDNAVLDTLLEKLRNGDSVGRKSRKNRRVNGSAAAPRRKSVNEKDAIGAAFEPSLPEAGDKTADLARDMLAALKSDGFEAFTPTTASTPGRPGRRSRQRRRVVTEFGTEELIGSPTFSDDRELSGAEEGDVSGDRSRHSSRAGTPFEEGDPSHLFAGDADATIRQR